MPFNQVGLPAFAQVLKNFGQQVQRQRLAQNLTQKALAEKSGVAYSTLRKIEASGTGSMGDYVGLWAALGLVIAPVFSTPPATPHVQRQRARRNAAIDTAIGITKGTGTAAAAAEIATPSPQVQNTAPLQAVPSPHRLGLDFPYDWSNAAMPDETLIAKVLQRARFHDVSKVFAHFGRAKVEQVAQDHGIDLQSGVLGSLMPGIRGGEALAIVVDKSFEEQTHTQNVRETSASNKL